MGLWLYLKFPNVIEAVKYFICLKDIISWTFCHFYEIIYENQQGPCYDIAFCFNNDRITEQNSEKKKKMLPGIFKFLALLFLVFLASDQVKLHFRVVHFVFHQCMMVCGRRSLIKEAGKKKGQRFYFHPHLYVANNNKGKELKGHWWQEPV